LPVRGVCPSCFNKWDASRVPQLTLRQSAGLGQSLNIIGIAALTASVACGTKATHPAGKQGMRGFFFFQMRVLFSLIQCDLNFRVSTFVNQIEHVSRCL
jgi:hypothetical protein